MACCGRLLLSGLALKNRLIRPSVPAAWTISQRCLSTRDSLTEAYKRTKDLCQCMQNKITIILPNQLSPIFENLS